MFGLGILLEDSELLEPGECRSRPLYLETPTPWILWELSEGRRAARRIPPLVQEGRGLGKRGAMSISGSFAGDPARIGPTIDSAGRCSPPCRRDEQVRRSLRDSICAKAALSRAGCSAASLNPHRLLAFDRRPFATIEHPLGGGPNNRVAPCLTSIQPVATALAVSLCTSHWDLL